MGVANMDFLNEIVDYGDRLKRAFDGIDKKAIDRFLQVLLKHYENESQIFIFGNGGSAMTASHAVCDFNKGVCLQLDKKFKFICLSDNVASLMAYANDISYADIFELQLRNFLKESDLVIGISGSGNSANVVKAVEYGRKKGAQVFTLCGFDGGKLKQVDPGNCLHVQISDMQIVEDCHAIIFHMAMQLLYKNLNKTTAKCWRKNDDNR
jgi:D-sedoheptulose 7-phosphate isomerase